MEEILALQEETEQVFIHQEIVQAVSNIVRETRSHSDISLGASTRSGIAFMKCLRAYALVKGRSFVTEDDVKDIAQSVLEHRLVFKNKEGPPQRDEKHYQQRSGTIGQIKNCTLKLRESFFYRTFFQSAFLSELPGICMFFWKGKCSV